MTGYGPPDDPSEAPTGQYSYSDDGDQQPAPGSTPWYRTRAALISLGALVAILLALVIYEIVDLTHGGGGAPSTSSTTPTALTTTTPPSPADSATSTEPVAPAPATTQTEAPTSSAQTTTAPTTTPPTSTSIDESHRHHRHHDGLTP